MSNQFIGPKFVAMASENLIARDTECSEAKLRQIT
jgi:hypothetical protein